MHSVGGYKLGIAKLPHPLASISFVKPQEPGTSLYLLLQLKFRLQQQSSVKVDGWMQTLGQGHARENGPLKLSSVCDPHTSPLPFRGFRPSGPQDNGGCWLAVVVGQRQAFHRHLTDKSCVWAWSLWMCHRPHFTPQLSLGYFSTVHTVWVCRHYVQR